MNKSLLSQVFVGAAFPVMMLAVGVSQTKTGPNQKDALRHYGRVAAEVQMGDRVRRTTEYWSNTTTGSPPVAEKSEANKRPGSGKNDARHR